MNKIKRLVITTVVAFFVVIGIGGTAHAAPYGYAGLYTNGYHFARYNSVVTAQAEARHAVQQAQVDGLGIGSVIVTDAESSAQSGVSKTTNDQVNQAFA